MVWQHCGLELKKLCALSAHTSVSPGNTANKNSMFTVHLLYYYPSYKNKILYRVSQNYVNSDLKDRVRTVVSSMPREMCVRALNGTVARWLLCAKQDGEQVETVL